MAKYDIIYGCGCTVKQELLGKIKDRESYIAWAATQDCPECKKAKYNTMCQEMAGKNNLPSLSGSEKQIIWAIAIRQTFLTNLQSELDERMKKVNDSNRERAMEGFEKIYAIRNAIIKNETSAKWWIDKRYDLPQDIMADYKDHLEKQQ